MILLYGFFSMASKRGTREARDEGSTSLEMGTQKSGDEEHNIPEMRNS